MSVLAISTASQKYEQPGLTIQAARNLLTNTTLNYERSQLCLYQKQPTKTTPLYSCHLMAERKFTGRARQERLDRQAPLARNTGLQVGGGMMARKCDKKKPNRPPKDQPFVWQTAELLDSISWRAMTINARRALDRIQREHMAHAGLENGNLIVTHDDFKEYGVSRDFVGDAIDELAYLNLVKINTRGRAGVGTGFANCFELTWLPQSGVQTCDDQWKNTTEKKVKNWKKSEREKARLRRRAKTPNRQPAFDGKYFPTPQSRSAPLRKQGVNGVEKGSKHPQNGQFPTPQSRSTSNILLPTHHQHQSNVSESVAQTKGASALADCRDVSEKNQSVLLQFKVMPS